MQVTDALLTDRLSAELAVDQALNPVERAAFRQHILVGPYDGAEPADWSSPWRCTTGCAAPGSRPHRRAPTRRSRTARSVDSPTRGPPSRRRSSGFRTWLT